MLLGLIPTKHSSILMSDLSGNLFASSSFASDVATIIIAPDGKKSFKVANVFTRRYSGGYERRVDTVTGSCDGDLSNFKYRRRLAL